MFSFQSVRVMCLAGVAGIAISLIPVWALAADLDRVEVTGHAVRTDVSRTCPGLGEQLADNLANAFSRIDLAGDYRIEFTLQGDKVQATKAVGGAWESRSALRRAMGRVDCQDAATATAPQRFAFLLSVRMEDDGSGQVARFDVKPATLVASAR
jgi:hypothetical protein